MHPTEQWKENIQTMRISCSATSSNHTCRTILPIPNSPICVSSSHPVILQQQEHIDFVNSWLFVRISPLTLIFRNEYAENEAFRHMNVIQDSRTKCAVALVILVEDVDDGRCN